MSYVEYAVFAAVNCSEKGARLGTVRSYESGKYRFFSKDGGAFPYYSSFEKCLLKSLPTYYRGLDGTVSELTR
jgi:hypothetical protein